MDLPGTCLQAERQVLTQLRDLLPHICCETCTFKLALQQNDRGCHSVDLQNSSNRENRQQSNRDCVALRCDYKWGTVQMPHTHSHFSSSTKVYF